MTERHQDFVQGPEVWVPDETLAAKQQKTPVECHELGSWMGPDGTPRNALGQRSHVLDHHMEIAPKSASHNAPAPLAPSISRQRTLHRESSNFHRWGQMHVCHLAEH